MSSSGLLGGKVSGRRSLGNTPKNMSLHLTFSISEIFFEFIFPSLTLSLSSTKVKNDSLMTIQFKAMFKFAIYYHIDRPWQAFREFKL